MALSLRTGAVVDDFGAMVDELTTRSCAAAIGKAARRLGLRRVLLATSHMSLVPYLGPDWVVTLPSSNSCGSIPLKPMWNPHPAIDRKPTVKLNRPGATSAHQSHCYARARARGNHLGSGRHAQLCNCACACTCNRTIAQRACKVAEQPALQLHDMI